MSFKNKKILVTGASGFIGSHLVKYLIKQKAKVYIIVKYNSVIENIRLKNYWNKINVIESDLRNLDSILKFNSLKFEIIYHLAAYNHVGDSFGNYQESFSSNLISTCNLIEYGPYSRKFIYMSTSEVYGKQEKIPFDENNLPHPISPYSVSKYAGELYTQMFKSIIKNPKRRIFNICRAFNTFGPFQSEKAVIPEIINKALLGIDILATKGLQTREFNYVDNIVDGVIKLSLLDKTLEKTINIGCGQDIRIKDLIQKILKLTKSNSRLYLGGLDERPTEILKMKAKNTYAKKYLKWEPKIKFDEGLIKTIDWYKKYQEFNTNYDSIFE